MNPLGLKAVAIVAVAAFAAGSTAGWRVTSWAYQSAGARALEKAQKQYRADLQTAIDKHAAALRDHDAAAMLLAQQLDTARQNEDALRLAAARIPLTIEVPREGACPESRLSDAFGLCFRAGLTGEASDLAACTAAGGKPGPVPPSSGPVSNHGEFLKADSGRAGGDAAELLVRDRPGVPHL